MESPHRQSSTIPWEFAATALARIVRDVRVEMGLSTRELARRAGVSQAYVVALEKARDGTRSTSPTPTLDVVCSLAYALGRDPLELTESIVRPAPRHTLLVLDDDPERTGLDALEYSRLAATPVDHWVWVASDLGNAPRRDRTASRIDIRRRHRDEFRPHRIYSAIPGELAAIAPAIRNRTIGIVFAESAHVITLAKEARLVLEVEHQWGRVVRDAAKAVNTRVGWNICVYESSILRTLPNTLASVCDLIASHDTVWSGHGGRVTTGAAAKRRILLGLRPPTIAAATWRDRCRPHLARLGIPA